MLTKDKLRPIYDLKQVLRNLHNHLYGGGPIKTESVLADEVAGLVLCKIVDEASPERECLFYADPKELKDEAGRELVYQRILQLSKELNGVGRKEFKLGSYWVAEAVNVLQECSLLNNRSYVSPLADVYEVFNSGQFKGGRGQFFTPPVVVNLAFEMLNPTIEDVVIDPACGSGNFLSKILGKYCLPESPDYVADNRTKELYIRTKLFGRDIEPSLVGIGKDYLRLLSGGIPSNISVGDSLNLSAPHYRALPFGRFTKIFTNPPFGNNIEITNPTILKQFDLGHQLEDGIPTDQLARGQHPDRLFLELCVKLLKKGGEAAIVLPRQILSGDELNAVEIRKWLIRNVTVLAVIDLPANTFQPHTGTITSLLFFRKGIEAERKNIFFAVCEHVGHDRRGLPYYDFDAEGNVIKDESGQRRLRDDTPLIINTWKEFKRSRSLKHQSGHGFLIDLATIKRNPLHVLNAWAYNPDASDAYKQVMRLVECEGFQEIIPLREACKSIFIPGRHKRKYVPQTDASIPFLSTTQIFHIHDIDYKYQPYSFAQSQDLLVEEGWILVTRSGSTGRVRYVSKELSHYSISDHCIRIVPDEKRIDSGYLYAFLSSKVGQLLIDQGRYASVIETISHTRLGEIPIPMPTAQRQKEIGDLVRQSEDERVRANITRQKAINLVEDFLV